jgi:hypothetical protein
MHFAGQPLAFAELISTQLWPATLHTMAFSIVYLRCSWPAFFSPFPHASSMVAPAFYPRAERFNQMKGYLNNAASFGGPSKEGLDNRT